MRKQLIFFFLLILTSSTGFTQQLILEGDGTSERIVVIRNEGNANSHSYFSSITASDQINTTSTFEGRRSRGTLDNLQQVTEGDRILALMGLPFINGSYRSTSAIEIWAGQSPGVGSYPTYITMSTTDNDQTARQERFRVSENGSIGIGSTDPKSRLHVTGGDVYVEDINKGVIMKSPDNNCWRYTPDNSGSLVGVMITCPN